MSVGALHHLLRERLEVELTRPELVRLKEATAGNPFFALELGREVARVGTRPAAGRALRVPESLRELLGARLARLPVETSEVLLYAAALARPTVELVSDAHGDPERVLAALDTALREGVVELDDSRVRFVHPLLASICYQQAPQWRQRAVHRALAATTSGVEERARHLALAVEGPDAGVASVLDRAAGQAAARGATAAAADLSELAAELTPADPALRRGRNLRAADLHRLAGDTERAKAMLEQLLSEVSQGVERADVLLTLALTLRGDTPGMIALCREALADASADDARSARILALRAWAGRVSGGDISAAMVDARTALERAERAGDPVLIAIAIAQVGGVETWTGEVTRGLLERGAEIERGLKQPLEHHQSPGVALARRLKRQGELDQARAILEELEEKAAARGDESTRAHLLWRLSTLEWFAGRLQRALELAAEAQELAEQAQQLGFRVMVGCARALIEVDLGLVEQARASAQEALAIAEAMSSESFIRPCHGTLGRLELALGNLEAAGHYLRGVSVQLLPGRLNDPSDPLWSDAIETLIALDELEEARSALEWQEQQAQRLGGRLALAAAARGRGLLEVAESNLTVAFAAFERALEDLQGLPYPLERGRTLLCLGSAHRKARQRRAARQVLEHALAVFEEIGARLWAEKARSELKRISGRRRASGELTETERRVAALAAQGLSNKEIAAALFMSVHTVSAHLTRIYRKLGVRSRTALAHRLAVGADEAAKV
jgi:ATP/maltotriose-dependent transcriptional regulator MalT